MNYQISDTQLTTLLYMLRFLGNYGDGSIRPDVLVEKSLLRAAASRIEELEDEVKSLENQINRTNDTDFEPITHFFKD